jgi:hypothetical protein
MALKQSDGSTPGSYPSGQKPREMPSTEIKAQVFREKDAKSKADQTGRAVGYDSQPGRGK